MKNSIVLFLLFVSFTLTSFGPAAELQQFNYEVIVFNKSVGTFTAIKTELNGRSEYRLDTKIETRIITKIEFEFAMISSFKDSKLIHSDIKSYMNNKLRKSSTVDFGGNHYITKTAKETLILNESSVNYSAASLYFQEPINRTHLFSENYGINLPIEALGFHRYLVTLPNGDRNYYKYEEGKVVDVEFDKSIINVKLRAQF